MLSYASVNNQVIGKPSLGRPPARWTDDPKKVSGSGWRKTVCGGAFLEKPLFSIGRLWAVDDDDESSGPAA
ncbi:jg23312 [Pararge aegeria aegeria]|uniref:Jg23312 protein n=1 Tax=Pararge aegeria aegeria TaxID=348720 RepID=A0A8S4RE77_9NEOP|nr:jg23312 [Pararge aegeria aegeria]